MICYFHSKTKNMLVELGRIEDEKTRKFIRSALGAGKIVEATKHTILSGPPGVGKSHGTIDECNIAGMHFITIAPGSSDLEIILQIALGVYTCPKNKTLIVVLDDADDIVFGNLATLNKWKVAMADTNHTTGMIPMLNHPVSMYNTILNLEKSGKQQLAEAIKSFQNPGGLGVSIPMDNVRIVVLCNKDLEDPKCFSRQRGMKDSVDAVIDRFNYKRIVMPWETQWGWLAHTLINTQPFSGYDLTDEQKQRLLLWMYDNWPRLRSTSYRMVRKLAESMINDPNNYEDEWANHVK